MHDRAINPVPVPKPAVSNVIALFGPDTPERIVIGAHYDAAEELPGADDNASGVAGLIELGYLLGRTPPPMRVELVGWTLEEPPILPTKDMGSARHVAASSEAMVKVRAAISLEMLGTFLDERGTQKFPAPIFGLAYPSTGNFITVVGNLGEGELELVRTVKSASAAPRISRSSRSTHRAGCPESTSPTTRTTGIADIRP